MTALIRLGGYGAFAGGTLKLIAAFIPYTPRSAGLELLYGAIDAGLLLGLIAVYLVAAERIGAIGLATFTVTLLALASLIGPEAEMFGIDFYFAGSAVFSLGLAAFAGQLLRGDVFAAAAWLWIASAFIGVGLSVMGSALAFTVAGMVLAVGFALAGYQLLQRTTSSTGQRPHFSRQGEPSQGQAASSRI
jgi:hypothetical protein